jgi:hypothetical protein
VRRALLALAAVAAVALAAPAQAKESGRWGTFQLRYTSFRPNVDDEFAGAAQPWADAFGKGRRPMVRLDVSKTILSRAFGSFDVGVGVGFFQARGHALVAEGPSAGQPSADRTTLRIIPTSLTLTYRFDVLAERWSIPIAPYAKASLERYNWWITRGSGGTAEFAGDSGRGATNGYGFGAGVAFLLDVIDRGLARDMDNDTGINHSYLFAEVSRTTVDDFGSSRSLDLSSDNGLLYSFGLLFVF